MAVGSGRGFRHEAWKSGFENFRRGSATLGFYLHGVRLWILDAGDVQAQVVPVFKALALRIFASGAAGTSYQGGAYKTSTLGSNEKWFDASNRTNRSKHEAFGLALKDWMSQCAVLGQGGWVAGVRGSETGVRSLRLGCEGVGLGYEPLR